MMPTRRSVLSSIAASVPLGIGAGVKAPPAAPGPAPVLRFRPFEEAVRLAFEDRSSADDPGVGTDLCRRVEVGHSDQVRLGVQGCHNDRPFAGFPAGHLRLIRTGSEPGPARQGIRLYVSTVDVLVTGGLAPGAPSRPLDFSSLPAAPILA